MNETNQNYALVDVNQVATLAADLVIEKLQGTTLKSTLGAGTPKKINDLNLVAVTGNQQLEIDVEGIDSGKITIDSLKTFALEGLNKATIGLGNVDDVQQMPLTYLQIDPEAATSNTTVFSTEATASYVATHGGTGGIIEVYGVIYNPDGSCDLKLAYDKTTRTVTVEPLSPATSCSYYLKSVKYTITTPQTVVHIDGTDDYYIYYNESNVLTASTTSWDILKHVPLCRVIYNASLVDGFLIDCRYNYERNLISHTQFADQIGAYVVPGQEPYLQGYTIKPTTPDNPDNQFSITGGTIATAGLRAYLPPIPKGDTYNIFYLSGAGTWIWDKTSAYPFLYGDYIKFNSDEGGNWTMAEANSGKYIKYYMLLVPAGHTPYNYQFVFVPSQHIYPNLDSARSENINELVWGNFPLMYDAVAINEIIFSTNDLYATIGKVRIEEINPIQISMMDVKFPQPVYHDQLRGIKVAGSGVIYGHIQDGNASALLAATCPFGTSTQQLASTEFVQNAIRNLEKTETIKIINTIPNGGVPASLNEWVIDSVNQRLYEFPASGSVCTTFTLPDNYAEGTNLSFYFEWTPKAMATTEAGHHVNWRLDFNYADVNGVAGATYDKTLTVISTCPADNNTLVEAPVMAVTGTSFKKGGLLQLIFRRGDPGQDTWGGTNPGQLPILLNVKVKYRTDGGVQYSA